ncbi:MAG: hypothetical protein WKF37_12710 [Bryobacteraceae bacterium]
MEHSFSPAFPRALLTRGATGLAAIGASPASAANPDNALTFGLLWLEYLRKRERTVSVEGLVLYLPQGFEQTTCLRLLHLDGRLARWQVFVCGDTFEEMIDLKDHGNLQTELPVRRDLHATPVWMKQIEELPFVECSYQPAMVTWRVRGLPFAEFDGSVTRFGLETKRTASASNVSEIEALAHELSRLRSPESPDRQGLLYSRSPELWLESQIRRNLSELDARLAPPVYGQVPAIVAGERGVLDLVAADLSGRLTVIEVKGSEDLHLPLQALDYWMRVKWHLDRDEFTRNGYFPGTILAKLAPRLLLVAPSLHFHPSNETVLHYFDPKIQVERIGVSMEWRSALKVVFRKERESL